MIKSKRQKREYMILMKNLKIYYIKIELFDEKYKYDKRNINYLNYSRFFLIILSSCYKYHI